MLVSEAVTNKDTHAFYEFIKEISNSILTNNHYFYPIKDLIDFFRKSICKQKAFTDLPIEGMEAIESLILNINKHLNYITESADDFRVNVPPNKLEGEEMLWRIMLEVQNEKVSMKAVELLNKLYTKLSEQVQGPEISIHFIEVAMEKLKEFYEQMSVKGLNRVMEIVKLLKLIDEMIDESEARESNSQFVLIHSLVKGKKMNIEVTLNGGKQLTLQVHSKITLWNLKAILAEYLKASPEYVTIWDKFSKVVNDRNNGKTLDTLKIEGPLRALLKPAAPTVLLSTPELKFIPKASQAFADIFHKFAGANSKLDKTQFKNIIKGLNKNIDISKFISCAYDKNKDHLNQEQFVQYFESLLKDNEDIVWIVLESLGYDKELRVSNSKEKSYQKFPRYILANNPKYFDFLFKLFGKLFFNLLRPQRRNIHRSE